jgi:ferric-dicitrate binding protein FerR (iron transport regulator)
MNDEGKHIDYDLLGKYLSGETSSEEAKLLEAWRDASKENTAEFERLKKLWIEAESLTGNTPAPVNTDAAWDVLHGRLFGEDEKPIMERYPDETGKERSEKETELRPEEKDRLAEPSPDKAKVSNLYYYTTRIAAVLVVGFIVYAILFMRDGQPEQIEVIAENTIKTTELPDNTMITLNEKSRITYPEDFKSKERAVELKGEAFFEVKPVEDKPFVVHVHNAVVRVLGTSFNVRAIEEESEITVTVEEGKVKLSDLDDIAFVELAGNEKGIFYRETGHIEKYQRETGREMLWRPRTVMFRDTELSIVFNTLERLFDTEIIIENEKILSCELNGKYQDQSIDEILGLIAEIFNLTVQKNNNTFEISGDGC